MIPVLCRSFGRFSRRLIPVAVSLALAVGARAAVTGDAEVADAGSSASTAAIIDAAASTGNRSLVTGNGVGSGAALNTPTLVAVAPNGTVYYYETLASGTTNCIISVNPTTGARAVISGGGTGSGPAFAALSGLAWDYATSALIVSDSGSSSSNSGILSVDPTTGNRTEITGNGHGSGVVLNNPQFVTVAANGTIYYFENQPGIATSNGVIAVDPSSGSRTLISGGSINAGSGTNFLDVTGMAWDLSTATLVVSDAGNSTDNPAILRVDPGTGARTVLSGGGVGSGVGLEIPEAVAVALNGNVYYVEEDGAAANSVVEVLPASGNRQILSGGGTGTGTAFVAPTGLAAANLAPVITNTTLTASGTVGIGFTPYTITAVDSPVSYNAVGLPGGLGVNSGNGQITGTPNQAGTFDVTLEATNAAGTGTATLVITINPVTLTVSPTSLPNTAVGANYFQTISAVGGTAPYHFAVTLGSQPTGLNLADSGVLSGAPTAAGTFTFTVTATDSSIGTGAPFTGTQNYTIVVGKAPTTVTFTSATQPYTGSPIALTATASPSVAGFSYSYSGTGSTTYGPTANAPTNVGTYAVTATVVDPNYTGSGSATLTITRATATVTLTSAVRTYTGSPIALTATASPNVAGFTYSYSGTGSTSYGPTASAPTNAGTYAVTATVADPNYTGAGAATLTISKAAATVTLISAVQTYTGSPIALTATASPTVAGFTYSYSGTGSTSYGPTANAPTNVGTYAVTATVADPNYTGTGTATLTISKATATVTLNSAVQTYTGSPIALVATASPNVAGFTYSYAGTGSTSYGPSATPPTNAGSYAVTATVNDTNYSGTGSAALTIAPAASVVTLNSVTQTYTGSPVPVLALASPSVAGFTYSYTGTGSTSYGPSATPPTNAGTYAVTATVNDPNYTGSASTTLTITPAVQSITFPTLPTIMQGLAYTLHATASSGLTVTFAIQSGDATITGGTSLKILNLSPVTIVASQSGNGNFSAAPSASQTVTAIRASTKPPTAAAIVQPIGAGKTDLVDGSPVTGGAAPLAILPATQTVPAGATATLTVATSGTCQWQFNGVNLDAVGSALTLANIGTNQAGTYSVQVTNPDGSVSTASATVAVTVDAHLANVSTRAFVGTTDVQALYAGFVLAGPGSAPLLIRGIGPALGQFGVGAVLAAPQLALDDEAGGLIAADQGWANALTVGASPVAVTLQPATADLFAQVNAFGLPAESPDSALVATLPAGVYSAVVSGAPEGAGSAMAELYDTGSGAAHLANLSARALTGSGGQILTVGFVIAGTSSETLLIRGVGPALSPFGLTGVLARPQISLFDAGGNPIATNAGWANAPQAGSSAIAAGLQAATPTIMNSVNAFALPAGSADSAFVVTLPPGAYTVQVSGADAASGLALLELYDVR